MIVQSDTSPVEDGAQVSGKESVTEVQDKGKGYEVIAEEPVKDLPSMDSKTPSPRGGLVDAEGFTLVVNKKSKVWIGSSSSSKGHKTQTGKSYAGLVSGRLGVRAVVLPPPSHPRGRGRGKK
ncbi:unnamed protein product [Linum trigynum]|uniref:Uncharacterized protein n=1 Tax=Linum trigynum TaxID=586398 RepID=A0AAV2D7R6_9ROSI